MWKWKLQKFNRTNEATKILRAWADCLSSFIDLLMRENKKVEQNKFNDIQQMVEKKKQLTSELEKIGYELAICDKEHVNAPENQAWISKVKLLDKKFQDLARLNQVLIGASMELSQILIDLYKKKHVEQTVSEYGYDDQGNISALKRLEKVMPAISVNNKI